MTDAQPWAHARRIAWSAATPLPSRRVRLADCIGHVLSESLITEIDIPSFDTAAMDGWAVAGDGPWKVTGRVLAGQYAEPLVDGNAVEVATGARVPPGTTAVLRRELGVFDGATVSGDVKPFADIRPRGEECAIGDELLTRGTRVTPAVLGLGAAAGFDELPVFDRPTVDIFVVGDELLEHGLPRHGRIRDALGPMLPGWATRLGAQRCHVRRVADQLGALTEAVAGSAAHVIVTTGGTAHGPVDHLHEALKRVDAELLVDGVQVRPGHPMLLARLGSGAVLVGLPGNPLAAVSGVVTLLAPVIDAMVGMPDLRHHELRLAAPATGHPLDTRIVPVREGRPLHLTGPAMLRGMVNADALAVVPPGGAAAGDVVELLPLNWL